MKSYYLYLIALVGLISACKKDTIPKEEKQEYVQHFSATINNVPITIETTQVNNDKAKLNGQWTGVGMANGPEVPMYAVNVTLPKENATVLFEPKLRLQIFGVRTGLHRLTGANSYLESFASYIVLSKRFGNGNNDVKNYVAKTSKKPFDVEITRYEYPKGSIVPYVGGKLNGVLYNEKDLQDSIVVENGQFEVRF